MRHERTIRLLAREIAHDFANYALVIRGHAELLAQGVEDGAAAAAILRASTGIDALSGQLWSIARPETSRPTDIDATTVVSDVVALLTLDDSAISAMVRIDARPEATAADTRIHADRHRLKSELIDLVFDAADAGATAVSLRIRVEEGSVDERRVVIDVVDDAPPRSEAGGAEASTGSDDAVRSAATAGCSVEVTPGDDGTTAVSLAFPQAQVGTVAK